MRGAGFGERRERERHKMIKGNSHCFGPPNIKERALKSRYCKLKVDGTRSQGHLR